LQKEAAAGTSIVIVDEVEHGLEPHRIIRLLGALGAKDPAPPIQVFMTSHSPVAVKELGVEQLTIVRQSNDNIALIWVGDHQELQGTARMFPEAFLAKSVLVCEGATEVGFMRGIDQWCSDAGKPSLHAAGTSLIDGGGDNMLPRAQAFLTLGYRTALLRDDDKPPKTGTEVDFQLEGGTIFKWREGKKIEVEIFDSIPWEAAKPLIDLALEGSEEAVINDQLRSASVNAVNLHSIAKELTAETLSSDARRALGIASGKKSGWFKTVGAMERVAREIIAPRAATIDPEFRATVNSIRKWCCDA
jgi:putative ATP-dependent endonuclease of OLD family